MVDMQGRVALVTGAATGIGRAVAVDFAGRGADVVIADVAADDAQQTADLVERAGGRAQTVSCDVTDPAQVAHAVDAAVSGFGRLDFAHNNAGIGGVLADPESYPLESWHQVLAVNLTGVFHCLQAELRVMLERGAGAIVNTASVHAHVAMAQGPAYVASKHGVLGLTKSVALSAARRGVRVNALSPGTVITPMLEAAGLAEPGTPQHEELVRMHALHRAAAPEEMARVVTWLCSDGASYVTGHALAADGGWLAR
jgi:NAD(P)-dependent dehydrogenase (short-subunit alcohol dehydrogenase family)